MRTRDSNCSASDSCCVREGTGGGDAALQSAHQRLCAVLLVKLMRRLLRSQPEDLSAQLARYRTCPCS